MKTYMLSQASFTGPIYTKTFSQVNIFTCTFSLSVYTKRRSKNIHLEMHLKVCHFQRVSISKAIAFENDIFSKAFLDVCLLLKRMARLLHSEEQFWNIWNPWIVAQSCFKHSDKSSPAAQNQSSFNMYSKQNMISTK